MRNSSVELLRIIAACMVVVLHINGVLIKDYANANPFLHLIQSCCCCAVDLFLIVSGFFLAGNTINYKINWKKIIYLFVLYCCIVISVALFRFVINDIDLILFFKLVGSCFPPRCYFLVLYIVMYLLSPYINTILISLDNNKRLRFLLMSFLMFSIYPTITDVYQLLLDKENIMGLSSVSAWGQQHGYNIVNFILCYLIGACIRLNNLNQKVGRLKSIIFYLICSGLIYITFLLFPSTKLPLAYNYSNPLVLLSATSIFIFTLSFTFKSKLVNSLAKAAFCCYIFHTSVLGYVPIELLKVRVTVYILYLFIVCVVIYLLSYLLFVLFNRLITSMLSKI